MAERIIVGMSGGVDSSVAAYLLQEQGYEVECLFMKNWEEKDPGSRCSTEEDYQDALQVCQQLKLRLHSVNFSKQYRENVFQYFLDEYRSGRTPNPDVLCNKEIKFKVFMEYALSLGADKIATGHYAKIEKVNHLHHLHKAFDNNKDQSYFLYLLGQKELSRTLFPLADMQKSDVRKLAEKLNLKNHDKKDSTGICFIGERNFRNFLQQYFPAQPGNIMTDSGQVAGRHEGLMYYTRGQRQGIGVGGGFSESEGPWYVIDKDLQNNTLIISQGHANPLLYNRRLYANQLHWITEEQPVNLPKQFMAKIRYRQEDQKVNFETLKDGIATLVFNDSQYAPAPGQSVVFYSGTKCLGGAIIVSYE